MRPPFTVEIDPYHARAGHAHDPRPAVVAGIRKFKFEIALELQLSVVVAREAEPLERDALVEEQKAYFDTLMAEVRRLYDEGKSDFEMKPLIAEKLKAYRNWAEWDANLGPQISLAILEIEQE